MHMSISHTLSVNCTVQSQNEAIVRMTTVLRVDVDGFDHKHTSCFQINLSNRRYCSLLYSTVRYIESSGSQI